MYDTMSCIRYNALLTFTLAAQEGFGSWRRRRNPYSSTNLVDKRLEVLVLMQPRGAAG